MGRAGSSRSDGWHCFIAVHERCSLIQAQLIGMESLVHPQGSPAQPLALIASNYAGVKLTIEAPDADLKVGRAQACGK